MLIPTTHDSRTGGAGSTSGIVIGPMRVGNEFAARRQLLLEANAEASAHQGDHMPIIPIMRCRSLRVSVAFYTGILDFERADGEDDPEECSVIMLRRGADRLFLSSDDGVFSTSVVVMTDDVDGLFRRFRERGLQTPGNPDAPKLVHEGPIDQTWGTREFYVEDPDGNTLRFTQ